MVNNIFNQSITVTRKINSSKDRLWEFISSPGYLNKSHPFCNENNIISWENNKHVDELIYLNNLTYIREFILWEDKIGYTLLIGEKNKEKSKVNWKISSNNNDTLLTITVYPYFMAKSPIFVSYLPYKLYIRPKLKNYLKSVIKGIDWYLEKKEIVPRNAFGKHSWFS